MIPELCPSEKIMSIKNPRWLPPQDESFKNFQTLGQSKLKLGAQLISTF
jgi:hypothetical protein